MPQEAILQKYPWAINPAKVSRAMQTLELQVKSKQIPSYSEEDVKALYVSYGGALIEDTVGELETRAQYMRNAGPIQKVVERAAQNLKERASKIVKKPVKKD